MKMKSGFLLLLYLGIRCCRGVFADNEHEIKKGIFPYMAFIYYSDPAVVDAMGQRFVRSAVLIRPDWLVTTALGPSLIDSPDGFPRKTLLARAGAVSVDANFTLNEDEDEQEREVIQIVRPYNHSATQWWTTDISLAQTLFPFNMTSAVGVNTLDVKHDFDSTSCSILVYARRYGNKTDDKFLMLLFVELLPPTIGNCGSHFTASTMICANDSDENKNSSYDPDFCHGNSGGPLICQQKVIALQTYIGNNCKQPYLYQLLSSWDNFITCGIEDKCQEEQCGKICDVTYKDPPSSSMSPVPTHDSVNLATATALFTEEMIATTISTGVTTEDAVRDNAITGTTTSITAEPEITTATSVTESNINIFTTKSQSADVQTKCGPKVVSPGWPRHNEAMTNKTNIERKYFDDDLGNSDREVKIEAQQKEKKKSRGDTIKSMCVVRTIFFGFVLMLCL